MEWATRPTAPFDPRIDRHRAAISCAVVTLCDRPGAMVQE
jgi:hypothetical protein